MSVTKLQLQGQVLELQRACSQQQQTIDRQADTIKSLQPRLAEKDEYQPWVVNAKWLTSEELKGFAKGTVNAYLCREKDKGGREDIKKAYHTLGLYLELSEDETTKE